MTADKNSLRIVHTESSCGWGGQEVRILTESQGMIRRGHHVQIVCNAKSEIRAKAEELRIPVSVLAMEKRNWTGLLAVRRWLGANSVDVINTHSSTDSWLFSLASRTVKHRPSIVRTRHLGAPVPNNPGSNWLYRHGADRVVTCGSAMRDQLIRLNGVLPDRCVSIPTGIDIARFQPGDQSTTRRQLNLSPARPLIGIVAALRREKGHQVLCEACKLLDRSDFGLVIIGDGLSRDLVRSWVEKCGLTDRTIFAGNQTDVVPWLQALDVFVLPSWGIEGVPQSIMQAMSCGLPVIATTVGSIGEAVSKGETGLLVPPQAASELASALRTLLEDASLRSRFGAAGRAKAITQFPIERMLDRMENVFTEVSRQTARRAA